MTIINLLIPFSIGLIIGACVLWIYYRFKVGDFHHLAASLIQKAENDAETVKKEAELEAKSKRLEIQNEIETWKLQQEKKILEEKERLQKREDKLEASLSLMEQNLIQTEKKNALLDKNRKALEKKKAYLEEASQKMQVSLENISKLSKKEATQALLEQTSAEINKERALYLERIHKETQEEAHLIASTILSTAINRLAVSCVSENTIFTVSLPNKEMKGRIIGREGRNIRTLEQATGVNFVIDDTPQAVILSGFDPVRRHIAKTALEELILDGRIHPTRIEEVVRKSKSNIEETIIVKGKEAALKAHVHNLHPEMSKLLGQLHFRYSLGQNVLEHSLEVSALMGMIAAELQLDETLARRIGLLHDIGKAVSHEVEGSHAMIGHDLALKYGECQKVAVGIGCHHNEIPPNTIEGSFCGSADAISASRTGARVEAVAQYIKRLTLLEEISLNFPGVEKAYAMQAGREVRVVVQPDLVDDDSALDLSRSIAKTIERRLSYPGKIKVTVIREKRAVEYAV